MRILLFLVTMGVAVPDASRAVTIVYDDSVAGRQAMAEELSVLRERDETARRSPIPRRVWPNFARQSDGPDVGFGLPWARERAGGRNRANPSQQGLVADVGVRPRRLISRASVYDIAEGRPGDFWRFRPSDIASRFRKQADLRLKTTEARLLVADLPSSGALGLSAMILGWGAMRRLRV